MAVLALGAGVLVIAGKVIAGRRRGRLHDPQLDMQVRSRAEDRKRRLEMWERSVRVTHHFLAERDVVALPPRRE